MKIFKITTELSHNRGKEEYLITAEHEPADQQVELMLVRLNVSYCAYDITEVMQASLPSLADSEAYGQLITAA